MTTTEIKVLAAKVSAENEISIERLRGMVRLVRRVMIEENWDLEQAVYEVMCSAGYEDEDPIGLRRLLTVSA
jgi:hypothetical protein